MTFYNKNWRNQGRDAEGHFTASKVGRKRRTSSPELSHLRNIGAPADVLKDAKLRAKNKGGGLPFQSSGKAAPLSSARDKHIEFLKGQAADPHISAKVRADAKAELAILAKNPHLAAADPSKQGDIPHGDGGGMSTADRAARAKALNAAAANRQEADRKFEADLQAKVKAVQNRKGETGSSQAHKDIQRIAASNKTGRPSGARQDVRKAISQMSDEAIQSELDHRHSNAIPSDSTYLASLRAEQASRRQGGRQGTVAGPAAKGKVRDQRTALEKEIQRQEDASHAPGFAERSGMTGGMTEAQRQQSLKLTPAQKKARRKLFDSMTPAQRAKVSPAWLAQADIKRK